MIVQLGCRKCSGDLEGEDDKFKCVECSTEYTWDQVEEVISARPRAEKPAEKPVSEMSLHEKGRYFLSHREEILEDYKKLGGKGMCHKWGMSPGGWRGMKMRWLKQGVIIGVPKRGGPTKSNRRPPNGKPEDSLIYWQGYRQAILDGAGKGR